MNTDLLAAELCRKCKIGTVSPLYDDGLCIVCRQKQRELPPQITQAWNRGNGLKYHLIRGIFDQYHVRAACGYRMDLWWLPDSFQPEPEDTCQKCARHQGSYAPKQTEIAQPN